jgi:glycerol-3-phosphate cytidylyltransferase|tara:strand:+ start:4337 stop:6787 length:2451 start_codon:yes stop_codon:yes gene_type:complete
MKKVITFGTFDLLHEGHLRILERAKAEGDYLIVGVSSDQLNDRKGKRSVFSEAQRLAYVADLRYVDEVFLEQSLELKDEYVKQFGADLLVMGDDWVGKFDWVSCDVRYLPRTDGISSTLLKTEIKDRHRMGRALFGDTYIDKHMDCALSIVNPMTRRNVAPILTKENALPRGIEADALVYFNKPINDPYSEYDEKQRVLIDHGASHLKWFLGSRSRFDFFDVILTAGPDHVRALQAIFEDDPSMNKVRAAGFVKSDELLSPPKMNRADLCAQTNLDPDKPIVLFVPTWHITANDDIVATIEQVRKLDNHVASFHPETAQLLPMNTLNTVRNINGITSELLKHADVVISDLSSTIYEAAALGKPIVQVLLKEYPDNTAFLYDLPLSAGTAEHFRGGLTCRPEDLVATVERALSDDVDVAATMTACKDRILAGTYISSQATDSIADQLTLVCETPRKEPNETPATAATSGKTPRHRHNMFFAQSRMIAHGGGNYDRHHASNSQVAMEAALNATNIVELDFCMGKDGIIVAHDGFEDRYGLNAPFTETDVATFAASKYEDALSPVPLNEAIQRCTRNGKALVCDIKPTGETYKQMAQAIREAVAEHGQIERTVIQCYSVADFVEAMRLGYHRVILAVWKYFYRDPLGADAFDFINRCVEINADAVWGISVPYTNKHMSVPSADHPALPRMQAFWKRVFIHGAPPEEYSRILKKNVGLFADHFSRQFEFKDIPEGFNWRHYLFLNRDLLKAGIDTEVQAAIHYLTYGYKENRLFAYDLPAGFNYGSYIDKNPKLRAVGITTIDSAASHYMRIGREQGLEY